MNIAKKEAFSLIEIIIVVAIIGAILGALIPRIMKQMKQAQVGNYKTQLSEIKQALIQYQLNFGKLPDEKQGLAALTDEDSWKKKGGLEAPLKETQLVDQNSNPIIYHFGRQNLKFKDEFKAYELLWVGDGTDDEPQLHDGN